MRFGPVAFVVLLLAAAVTSATARADDTGPAPAEPAFEIDGIAVNDPSVLELSTPDGGTGYLMYFTYCDYSTPGRRGLTGPDGITWNGAWAPYDGTVCRATMTDAPR